MPRNITSAMLAYMAEPSVALAVLVLITRTDGLVLGFTDWDMPVTYNGVTYQPAISMQPSGVKINSDLTTDQMDIIGAIDSELIVESDIDGGRFDMAAVQVMRVNPNDLTMGAIIDLTGTVGEVDYGEGQFQAAINSLGCNLNQQLGDIITPSCRVQQLGDFQCKVNIASYQTATTIDSVDTTNRILTFSNGQPSGYYDYGMVRFATAPSGGNNYDINMEVKYSVSIGATYTTYYNSTVTGNPTGGNFTLTVTVAGGTPQTTAPIGYNASAANVLSALEALSNVGSGNMSVSSAGGGNGNFNITPAGSLAGQPVLVQADGTNLLFNNNITGSANSVIVESAGGSVMWIMLVQPLPFPANVGDAVVLEAGCDRSPYTCRTKFSNLINIHAEPYVPGNDYLMTMGRPPS